MTASDDFDQNQYWIDRHRRLKGDPRSVGNLSNSLEHNKSAERRIQQWVACAAQELKPYQSVLDVGCGYGRTARAFCEEGYAYTGIDVSSVALDAARENEPRGHYLLGSALDTDFGRKFDLICVLYVFVHFVDDDDWLMLISTLAETLNPGGGLLFADRFPEERVRSVPHVSERPLALYEEAFESCHLKLDMSFRQGLAAALGVDNAKLPPAYLARRAD